VAAGLSISAEPFESADARRLVAALDAELAALYPPENRFGQRFTAGHAVEGRGTFLVARLDGTAVGCGAFTLLDAKTAEVKRMYAAPEARGTGVGRAVLERLETKALAMGVRRLVLETGIHQLDAIRLYERAGYRRVECWGDYAGVPTSVCCEKLIGRRGSKDLPS
jgi:putative acetyltransferase